MKARQFDERAVVDRALAIIATHGENLGSREREMNEIFESVRRFAAGEIAPHAAEVDRGGQLPAGLFRKLGEQGLAGLAVGAKWGGIAADLASYCGCIELIAGACASSAWALIAHSMCARAVLAAGTEAQKDRLLPEFASGRRLGSAMTATEAGGGSNLTAIRTRARRDGEGWVLDGGKEFISLAGFADVYVVMVRTGEPPAALGCFLVEKGDSGLSFGRREKLLGMHGVPVGALVFEGYRLAGDRLLGAETGALGVMGAAGAWGLAGASAAAIGIAAAALEEARTYVSERVVAGAALAGLSGVQAIVADQVMELAAARASLAQALRDVEGRKGPPLPLFMAKLATTQAAVRIVDRCMALQGAAGYSCEFAVERHLRDVRAFTIHFGNNEVLRDTLHKAALA